MNVIIVDDHILFREGLVSLFNGKSNFKVVGEAGSVREAIELAREVHPDLILMDFSLPDGTGLDATRAILRVLPETKIVFLTVHEDDSRLFDAIRSGAKGYILKNLPISKLFASLEAVERGEVALTRSMTSRILDRVAGLIPEQEPVPPEAARLTARELEVLQLLERGATNREIATELVISERTVKNHVSNILSKLNLKNRLEAARYARRYGIIDSNNMA